MQSPAASNSTASEKKSALGGFHLLPKSLQSNPELDMTVFTEMSETASGSTPPSAKSPVYYVAQADGFNELGDHIAGEKNLPPAHMDYFVRKALAAGGFEPVPSVEKRPSLMILYRWGSYHAVSAENSSDLPDFADNQTLERARLVGGKKLVAEMAHTMEWGESLLDNTPKKQYLREQAFASCYYVILFAYDYEEMVHGKRRLRWRTNMTVDTRGVSLRETLPVLISSAAPYLGREMREPAITSRQLSRNEKIEIGPTTVLEDDNPGAPKPSGPSADPAH